MKLDVIKTAGGLAVAIGVVIYFAIEESGKHQTEVGCYGSTSAMSSASDYVTLVEQGDKLLEGQEYHSALQKYLEANNSILYEIETQSDEVQSSHQTSRYQTKAEKRRIRKARSQAIAQIHSEYQTPRSELSFKMGFALQFIGDKPRAIHCYTDSLNRFLAYPNSSHAYANRGDLYLELGEKTKALSDYQQAAGLYKANGHPSHQKVADKINSLK